MNEMGRCWEDYSRSGSSMLRPGFGVSKTTMLHGQKAFHLKQLSSLPRYGERFRTSKFFVSSYVAVKRRKAPVKHGNTIWNFFIQLEQGDPSAR